MISWITAVIIAAALEAPQTFAVLSVTGGPGQNTVLRIIDSYHVPALWFANWILLQWNPISQPPLRSSSVIAWISVFCFQVIITAPIIYVLLRWARSRITKTS